MNALHFIRGNSACGLSALAGAVVGCFLRLCPASAADTHHVSPTGTDEFPYLTPERAARSIQGAIDAADAGDMVDVAPGDYVESVTTKPRLILCGAGPNATRVHGFVFAAEDVVLRDLAVVGEDTPAAIVLGPFGGQRVDNCLVSGPLGVGITHGGGSAYMPASPIIVSRCRVAGPDKGIRLRDAAPPVVLDRCTISGCDTGIACYWGEGRVSITRCSITDNVNGMYFNGNWEVDIYASSIDRSLLTGLHVADQARLATSYSTICFAGERGIYADWAHVDLLNCTISGNDWGVVHEATVLSIRNSIVWGNASVDLYGLDDGGTVTYSDIGGGFPGEGNIDADPMFSDSATGDVRLRPGSPCIDAGQRARADPPLDKDGRPNWLYGGRDAQRADMGAYEYYINDLKPAPDADGLTLTWSSLRGRTYSLFYTEDLLTWHLAVENSPSAGDMTTSWIDDGSKTGVPPSLVPRRFYRILENP